MFSGHYNESCLKTHKIKSEIDLAPKKISTKKSIVERVDIAYLFKFKHATFMIENPKCKIQLFGIFRIFSLLVRVNIAKFCFLCFQFFH